MLFVQASVALRTYRNQFQVLGRLVAANSSLSVSSISPFEGLKANCQDLVYMVQVFEFQDLAGNKAAVAIVRKTGGLIEWHNVAE